MKKLVPVIVVGVAALVAMRRVVELELDEHRRWRRHHRRCE